MEDPFAYLTKYSKISESQAEYFRLHDFELEDLTLQENSSASESTQLDPIIICSPPMDSIEEASPVQQEEECFQTPEENLSTQDLDEKIDGIGGGLGGGESSVAVDLGRDTDLLFSDGNMLSDKVVLTEIVDDAEVIRSEMSKNEFLVGESYSMRGNLDFDLNDIPDDAVGVDGDVEELRDEETEEIHVFSGDVEMDVSPLVPGIHNSGAPMVDLEPVEHVEFPDNSQPEDDEKNLENETSDAIGTVEVQDKFEISDSNGAPSAITRNSSAENATQAYVKLSDLVNSDDNDILAVAIKAGMKFPRPRWWHPAGYGPGTSQPLISRLLDYNQAVAEGKIH